MIELKVGDRVESLISEDNFYSVGDVGVIVDMANDVDVGVNCIVDFSGSLDICHDGLWWVDLSKLKLII